MSNLSKPPIQPAAQAPVKPTSPLRLLGVWPHPDDEAYLSAGLMGRVADSGGHVTVLTATRGELGTADPASRGHRSFAALRESELRASLAQLGVGDLRLLGYPDGGCPEVPAGEAVAAIASVMDEVRPHLTITFGPDGMTGHPDHRTVWQWATVAWARAGWGRLLYATKSADFAHRFTDLHDRLGVFTEYGLDGPVVVPDAALAVQIEPSNGELDRKRRALACHHSQTADLAALVGETTYCDWVRTEWFRRPTRRDLRSALAAAPVEARQAAMA